MENGPEESFIEFLPAHICPKCSESQLFVIVEGYRLQQVFVECAECNYESGVLTRLFGCKNTQNSTVFESARSIVQEKLETTK